jgi:CubicO group peptidase (beta-lactamase class C family)
VNKGEFFYSNTGFIVAAAIAEKITGRTWHELMREELFEPLGMHETGFMAPGIGCND